MLISNIPKLLGSVLWSPYNTEEDWAVQLQGKTVLDCVIQQSSVPREASGWRGKRVRWRISAANQRGIAEAG